MNKLFTSFIFWCIPLIGFSQQHKIYLMGDAGVTHKDDPTLIHFLKQIDLNDSNSTVIYLGDNIYPHGLVPVGDKLRSESEEILNAQLLPLKNFKGNTFIIPGNHDYNRGRKNGLQRLHEQEKYVRQLMGDSTFVPFNGCPDPVEIPLADDITLLLLDTQWLLFEYQDNQDIFGCDYKNTDEFLIGLEDIISRNKNKKLVVAGHHPIHSYGEHGGHFTAKDHIFPLTSFAHWAYVPLPVIGSIYPFARKRGVSRQDIPNKNYQKIVVGMESIFKKHQNVVYVSGHEHALELIEKEGTHYIVSGSGSKTSPVYQGKYAKFAQSTKGFATLIYDDDSTKISYYDDQQELFHYGFYQKIEDEEIVVNDKALPDTVVMAASKRYKASASLKKWMGENYRTEWETPVKMPVFDLSKMKGGLKIVQKGGGMATLSFRLEDKNGNQYTLRSIDKNPEKAIPQELKETVAKTVVQDQISAAHPYSPLTVPTMADAINIYHCNPQVFYVEDDPQFGIYQELAANKVFMFEERPSKNEGKIESFGNSKKIYSTIKTVQKLREDNDNYVDYKFTLRNRLFDMLIGDWDRHDDQWRWASFKNEYGEKMFRPIPRDRDQVFFVNEGRIPNIASHRWVLPKFEGFDEELNWAPGFNFNARYFDRYFLAQANWSDWEEEVKYIQEHLTDDVFEQALQHIPTEVNSKNEEIIGILKARRAQLPAIAKEYYAHISKRVSVLGSDKSELFEVHYLEGGKTRVTVKKISKKGNIKQTLFDRTFDHEITKEIRIYGLSGDDQFTFKGDHHGKIKIRVIGGDDKDQYSDVAKKGASRKVKVYDNKSETEIAKKGSFKNKLSDKVNVNEYNREDFKFNSLLPMLYGGFIPDDGVMLGGGFIFTKYGFRKSPYSQKHTLYGAISTNVAAFKLKYKGQFVDVVGGQDVIINAELRAPRNSNYYGLGNESEFNKEIGNNYYRFFYTRHIIEPGLLIDFSKSVKLNYGASYRYYRVSRTDYLENRYFLQSGDPLTFEDPYGDQNYLGGQFTFTVDKRDNSAVPKNGVYMELNGNASKNMNNDDLNYVNIGGEIELFKTFKLPTDFTIGYKLEANHLFGEYHFLTSNRLGGNKSLRGYRRDRFYGRSSLLNSFDARLDIFNFKNSILPMTVGILGFYDIGRVWLDGENSDTWHEGYGGGVYLVPIDKVALSGIAGGSKDGLQIYLNIGFSF
ncbi:BamA/TamA family outer membrane protein [Flammeovirga yaeyamensis]|uniref:BamA/TamA family outer membrane protein n=1 Tax=Flammeovirga yaeyamensis TaxID=367791 RepID=A0AAX1NF63_9BACT|nr:BamA/TamA family outer membrane protein [Flammeovirga yaeyamensis]MBB3696983.1 putative phosphodiesterase [Flammeovirga yaeyamensis]NMF33646.1 BamA/TamA family outer membrane protein [Flammeovirga yaeyamensis]QWG05088.1 BamA/TamA family outer membrane protein [Flammeovirga yaeyamensis]